MSSVSLHKEICPKCRKEQMIKRYDSINDYHKELFSKIIDKTIFDYKCECCNEIIHAPYPLLFHKMGIRDIQIGYKVTPLKSIIKNPFMTAMKVAMEDIGQDCKDISECYDDENKFANRIKNILNETI